MKDLTITKVNGKAITIIQSDEDRFVPIKPICEALNIDYSSQVKKIKDDEFLSSTMVLSTTVGKDKKDREMVCLPYRYVFGWLFTINPANVKESARAAVKHYRIECYNALYDHFAAKSDYLQERQIAIEKQRDFVQQLEEERKLNNQQLTVARKQLNLFQELSFDDWKAKKAQQMIPFPEVSDN